MKGFFRSKSGYTIIELMVVVVIMSILTGTLISFSRLGQDQISLYVEASKVVDVILRAKSFAISAYREPGSRAACAHGLHLDLKSASEVSNAFSLNRYLKKEVSAGPPPVPCASIGTSTSMISNYDMVVAESSTYVFSKGIVFDRASTTIADIIFRPPDPQIFFFNADGSIANTSNARIVIKDSSGNGRMEIRIGQGGQITYNFVN